MPRPTPVPPCNLRFANEMPASGSPANASDRSSERIDSDRADAESSSAMNLFEVRKLDEASVDACFNSLSDLLADIC